MQQQLDGMATHSSEQQIKVQSVTATRVLCSGEVSSLSYHTNGSNQLQSFPRMYADGRTKVMSLMHYRHRNESSQQNDMQWTIHAHCHCC